MTSKRGIDFASAHLRPYQWRQSAHANPDGTQPRDPAPGQIMDIRELKASERRLLASSLFHTDAQSGQRPKISYRIPDDAEIGMAERLTGNVRGQSPNIFWPARLAAPRLEHVAASTPIVLDDPIGPAAARRYGSSLLLRRRRAFPSLARGRGRCRTLLLNSRRPPSPCRLNPARTRQPFQTRRSNLPRLCNSPFFAAKAPQHPLSCLTGPLSVRRRHTLSSVRLAKVRQRRLSPTAQHRLRTTPTAMCGHPRTKPSEPGLLNPAGGRHSRHGVRRSGHSSDAARGSNGVRGDSRAVFRATCSRQPVRSRHRNR